MAAKKNEAPRRVPPAPGLSPLPGSAPSAARATRRSASSRVKKAVTKKVAAAKAAIKKVAPKSKAEKLEAARERAAEIYDLLQARHPDAHCELDHRSPFELIVATVLSAQSTDVMVNKVTPELFKRFPDAKALAKADPAEVEKLLGKLGMFRQKTKSVIALSQSIVEQHGGEVPRTLAELVKLRGVGRKTANVVLGVAFGTPEGVVVDTHVQRLSQRLGLTRHSEPPEIEEDLMQLYPRERWDMLSHLLIFHGRRVCTARSPACAACNLNQICPSAFKAELVGRKPARERT